MGSGGDDITVLEGVGRLLSSHQTGDVGHIHHEDGTIVIGNLTHAGVVPFTGIRRSTADEDLGTEDGGVLLKLVVVDETSLGIDVVGHSGEEDGGAREVLTGVGPTHGGAGGENTSC